MSSDPFKIYTVQLLMPAKADEDELSDALCAFRDTYFNTLVMEWCHLGKTTPVSGPVAEDAFEMPDLEYPGKLEAIADQEHMLCRVSAANIGGLQDREEFRLEIGRAYDLSHRGGSIDERRKRCASARELYISRGWITVAHAPAAPQPPTDQQDPVAIAAYELSRMIRLERPGDAIEIAKIMLAAIPTPKPVPTGPVSIAQIEKWFIDAGGAFVGSRGNTATIGRDSLYEFAATMRFQTP